MIKPILKETLGCRTLALAALTAVAGAVATAWLGAWLWRHALAGIVEAYPRTFDGVAGAVYGIVGGVVAFASVMLTAAARAAGELWVVIRPVVERCAIACVEKLPSTGQGVEIAKIEEVCERACAAAVVDVPVFKHVSKLASTFAHRRMRRHLDPFLAPMRETGQTHINSTTLQTYATDAGTSALIDLVRAQITRPQWIGWLAVVGMMLVPAGIWAYRAITSS